MGDSNMWCGEDYSTGISKERWTELLKDDNITGENALKVLMRFKDYGGAATCKQLTDKYGGTFSSYNMTCTQLAKRVQKATGCPQYKDGTDENAKWWPILFLGKPVADKKDGTYIWKLRDELSAALDMVELPYGKLYDDKGITQINAEERRQCFTNWAYAKAQANGIKKSTADGYISALNRMWKNSTAEGKLQTPYEYGYGELYDYKNLQPVLEANGGFADSDGRLGFNWYLEFLAALRNQPFGDELIKFRNLLKWFVWQVRVHEGILDGESSDGKGCKDSNKKIRSAYSAWREYNGFTLDCTLFSYNQTYYIHLSDTWLNITPVFDYINGKKDVIALQITIKKSGNEIERQYPAFVTDKLYVDNNDYSDDNCPYYLKDLFALFKEEIKFYKMSHKAEDGVMTEKQPKNLILYGPPGTGKTYNTAKLAMEIINGTYYAPDTPYDDIKSDYDRYLAEGRIRFVTFHQSYGYEEFIEGIKPETTDDGGIRYKVEDGVFKTFCERASAPIIEEKKDFGLNPDATVWKVSLEGTGDNATRRECLDNGHIRIGFDSYGADITDETAFDPAIGGKVVLNAFINKMQAGDIVLSCYSATTIDAIGVVTGEYEWHDEYSKYKRLRKVKWLVKDIREDITKLNNNTTLTLASVYKMNISVSDVVNLAEKYNSPVKAVQNDLPYVFIIDEINRGNISKIFGELITLIEENKREGEREEARVILPYSKKPFAVPSNVYIIGTMNTADRSVAALDTALRRRFSFKEMMPDIGVLQCITVEGIDIARMLETINKRIEVLYDREHAIGHAYFKKLEERPDIQALAEIFRMNVIPLLQEYFYEDYEKIRLVLADNRKPLDAQFVVSRKIETDSLFGRSSGIELDAEYAFSINKNAFENPQAYIGIYSAENAE